MTGRCQRCGKACEGTRCPPCQAMVAGLQAKEQKRPHPKAERSAESRAQERKSRRGPAPAGKYPAASLQREKPNGQLRAVGRPGAVVPSTFKPAGRLRVYRPSRPARFNCLRCGKDKTVAVVAIVGNDQAKKICLPCYRLLERDRAKAPKAARPLGRTKRQPSGKSTPGQPTVKPPPPIGTRERRQLQRRFPGVEPMLAFFRAANLNVELVRGGCLWIGDRQTGPFDRSHVPAPGLAGWNSFVDNIALRYAGRKFMRVVEVNAQFGDGLRAFLRVHSRVP